LLAGIVSVAEVLIWSTRLGLVDGAQMPSLVPVTAGLRYSVSQAGLGARFRRGFMRVWAGTVGGGLGKAFLLVSAVENAHCPPWGWQALGAGLDSAHRSATMLWWAFLRTPL
jgi:hypothetical protein